MGREGRDDMQQRATGWIQTLGHSGEDTGSILVVHALPIKLLGLLWDVEYFNMSNTCAVCQTGRERLRKFHSFSGGSNRVC